MAKTARFTIKAKDDTKKGVKSAEKNLGSLGKTAKAVGGMLTGALGLMAMRKIVQGVGECIEAFGVQEQAIARMEATLRSTGGASGMMSQELQDMAAALQKVTTFGDEMIMGAQALLLSFTRIGRDVFPRATESILNMATAMGTDLQSVTLQVGKALNDPILGVTALGRAGVQFTLDQKAMIKSLVETGQEGEAQRLILAELETQFGGVARAAADTATGGMQQFRNQIGDIKEDIGAVLIPALSKAAKAFGKLLDKMQMIMGYGSAMESLNSRVEDFRRQMAQGINLDMYEDALEMAEDINVLFAIYGSQMNKATMVYFTKAFADLKELSADLAESAQERAAAEAAAAAAAAAHARELAIAAKLWKEADKLVRNILLSERTETEVLEDTLSILKAQVGYWADSAVEAQNLAEAIGIIEGRLEKISKTSFQLPATEGMLLAARRAEEAGTAFLRGEMEAEFVVPGVGGLVRVAVEIAHATEGMLLAARRAEEAGTAFLRGEMEAEFVVPGVGELVTKITTLVTKFDKFLRIGKGTGIFKDPMYRPVATEGMLLAARRTEEAGTAFLHGEMEAGLVTPGVSTYGGASSLAGISDEMEMFRQSLLDTTIASMGLAGQFLQSYLDMGEIGLLLEILKPAIQGVFSVLGPAIDAVLIPLMNAMNSIGQVIAVLLLPIITGLAPVMDALLTGVMALIQPISMILAPIMDHFGWVLETLVVPIIKVFASQLIGLSAPIQLAADLFGWLCEGIKTFVHNIEALFTVGMKAKEYKSYEETGGRSWADIWAGVQAQQEALWADSSSSSVETAETLDALWDTFDWEDFSFPDLPGYDAPDIGGGGTGASYQSRQLTVNIVVKTSAIVGEDGIRTFAIMIRDEIGAAEALGA